MMKQSKKSVLFIGAGKFVQETAIPALAILEDDFYISAIVNKSGVRFESEFYDLKFVPITNQLESIKDSKPDIVFLSVPLESVHVMLKKLIELKLTNTTLLITTPVIPVKALRALRLIKKFTRSYAFEFVPFLPIFVKARELIEQGHIGELQEIELDRFGYKYHGLATIRSFVGLDKIIYAKQKQSETQSVTTLLFKHSIKATMKEPRDYANGSFSLKGKLGTIRSVNSSAPSSRIIRNEKDNNGVITGLNYNGKSLEITHNEELLKRKMEGSATKTTDEFRQQCILAASNIFSSIYQANYQVLYSIENTIYDNLSYAIIAKLKWFTDPVARFSKNSTAIFLLIKLVSNLRSN